ncbi:MAG: hypothetical protein ACPL4I_11405 [Bacteroidota bacterium]
MTLETAEVLQVVVIGVSTGFGSALGTELAKALIERFRGAKVEKK